MYETMVLKYLFRLKNPKLLTSKGKTQDSKKASLYGKRSFDDGIINWDNNCDKINKLIRASSDPHPGAFTFFG